MKARFLTAVLILSGLFVTVNISYACPQSPLAILTAFKEYVILGRSVILDGSDSYDPNGSGGINGIWEFGWDFTDNSSYDYYEYCWYGDYAPDGAFDGKTTYTYDANGTYTVRLRVIDDDEYTDTDTCTVYVSGDSDSDGLPDDWETVYDLNSVNPDDADQDSDSDGYNNLSEYLHGSEPNNASSYPPASFNITIYVPVEVDSIQRAINASIDGDTIVVSTGTYYEVVDFNGVSCTLTSTDPNDWGVIADTIIDGDDPNAYVVTFENSEDANSVLKGFTITGGEVGIYCDGASPSISNCVIADNTSSNNGGGMYDCNSSPTITNCVFSGNKADYGGGMYDVNSSPILISCVFVDNLVDVNGAGIYNYGSSPIVINCTFSENYAYGDGGGMYSGGASEPNLTNCIFWSNEADGSGDEICNDANSDPNFRYCDIQGCGGSSDWDPNFGSNDGNNIDADPNFIDANDPAGPDDMFGTLDDGLRVQVVSPCIDAADGDAAPTKDISGSGRIDVSHVGNTGAGDPNYADIGAYESPTIWFVDKDATGNDDGTSWEDAFTDLKDALADANDGDEIWVAEGTHKPDDVNDDRSVSFELADGVGVYGGFAGTEGGRHQRDWTAYKTILSGDIGTPNDMNDNSYHVVKGADNAVLDGFVITGGNANGSNPDYFGGGIYCSNTSPTITNCVIAGNSGTGGAGIFCNNTSLMISNCLITGNTSTAGGGMYNYLSADATLTSCTFSGNSAENGGGMFNYISPSSPSPTVINCIFWADTAENGQEICNWGTSLKPSFSYCDIEGCGGSSGWDPNFGADGGGNIDSDPCFVDINNPAGADGVFCTWDDGLRLMGSSPCIDAADGDAAPSKDILGRGRIDLEDVDNTGTGNPDYADMGTYESYDGVDSDGDGMPDDWELIYGLDPTDSDDAELDGDNDGLTNLQEYWSGTDPTDSDSDNDSMPDGWEVDNGFDPLDSSDASEDSDNDGLSNLGEYNNNTDPQDTDTDKDYMPDGWEVDNGLDPNSATGDDGANGNLDGDNFANLSEYLHGSDPNDQNSIPESTTTITVPTEAGSIQWAIDLSIEGDVIEVLKGRYYETIDFNDIAITLTSTDPNDWWVVESTIIDGNGTGTAVVTFDSDDASSTIIGLTLTNGQYGVSCSSSSCSPVTTKCIIEKNSSHGIYCTSGSPEIRNSMIGENNGAGIYSSSSSSLVIKNNWIYKNDNKGMEFSSCSSETTVRNNTIAYNTNYGIYVSQEPNAPAISNCIIWSNNNDLYGCSATYSCIKNSDAGQGNITGDSNDPLFIDADGYDYRLQRTSPCINAGNPDPNITYTDETDIEGEVRKAKTVDMGADEVCEVHNDTQDIWYSSVDSEGIQDAIDDANNGDVIVVYEWTFYESIDFNDVNIMLTSTDPCDWDVVECTIIDANDSDANVVTFNSGQDAGSVLTGLTLTGGKNGVYCDNSSSPVIRNCIITDNNSAGITCTSGSPLITNNKIGENGGDGIYSSSSTPPTIKYNWIYENENGIKLTDANSAAWILNNTIADNNAVGVYRVSGTDPNINSCILWGNDGNDLIDCNNVRYSCVEEGADPNYSNISEDPLFHSAGSYNYHLEPDSPCLSAADPCLDRSGHIDIDNQPADHDIGGDSEITYFVNALADSDGDGTWASPYKYLQLALKHAGKIKPNNIFVAGGTYYPDEHSVSDPQGTNLRDERFKLEEDDVEVYGGFPPRQATEWTYTDQAPKVYVTILSGDIRKDDVGDIDDPSWNNNSFRVVEARNVNNATLNGFIIESGNADDRGLYGTAEEPGWTRGGGGMRIVACSPIVANCTFQNNKGTKHGGAIACASSSPEIIECTFIGNKVQKEVGTAGNGGAIACWNSSYSAPYKVSIRNCDFSDNYAFCFGGAICIRYSESDVIDCTFTDNTGCWGGAIANEQGSDMALTNSIFVENVCWQDGSGLSNWHSTVDVTNCTFVRNEAGYRGGGVFNLGEYSFATLKNSILWENTDDWPGNDEVVSAFFTNPVDISYCCIENCGNSGENWDHNLGDDEDGNIENTELVDIFVNIDDPNGPDRILSTTDDGLRLAQDSPCIDAGDNGAVSESKDILGNDRIFNNRTVDMGAYEFWDYEMIYVDKTATGKNNGTTWTNAFAKIQDAIDAGADNDEIWVKQATYVLSAGLSVNKQISIYGGFNGTETLRSQRNWETYTTTVDGDNIASISCFFIWDKCTTIDGFTITKAGLDYFNTGTGIFCNGGSTTITNCTIIDNIGGGIACTSSSSPTITNCTFSSNGAVYSTLFIGGGISISLSSSPTISNCEFNQNIAGAIDCDTSSTATITNCTFSGNSSGTGGAIECFNSSPTISDCVFTGNGADGFIGDGGAIHCLTSSPTIEDCVFTDNTAEGDGGAIYCTTTSSSSPTIERCVFSGNTAEDDGGGFYSLHSTPTLINCLFIENEAENGGGIATWRSNGSSVINCTFYGNESLGTYSDRGGGAVYAKASLGYYCSTTLTNCILWGNTAANDGHEVCCDGYNITYKARVTLEYCDIQDTTDWMYEVDESDSVVDYLNNDNIYDDPDFVNTGVPKGGDDEWATSDDGFMLDYDSECINRGDDVTGYPHYISEDITGNDRKINGYVDIGAYEYDP